MYWPEKGKLLWRHFTLHFTLWFSAGLVSILRVWRSKPLAFDSSDGLAYTEDVLFLRVT